MLEIIKNDPWLEPYKDVIEGRYSYIINKENQLTQNGKISYPILQPDTLFRTAKQMRGGI